MKQNLRQFSLLASVVMFSVLMITSQVMLNATYAEEVKTPIPNDSVGDIHVRAIFSMNDHEFTVDNFKVFDQMEGFNGPGHQKTSKPTFQLWGAPDVSHVGLYHVADTIHKSGTRAIVDSSLEFDTYIEIYQGEKVFRIFDYQDCLVANYVFTTLHDGDETFSGKTQFVYADVFQLECAGYTPINPLIYNHTEYRDTESSLDWKGKQRSTWTEEFR